MPEGSPRGIRTIALARTVRWVGWGFGEPLLPVFIAMFAATFAEAGLIRSAYDLVTLLALPVIGTLADRYPARTLILLALIIYPLVGIGYFLAGVTGFAIFLILARIVNGVAWGLESVGVDTYYRRMTPSRRIGSAFGYIDTIANFGWLLAALSSIWLVTLVPIHWLLLAIAPFTLIAYLVARRARPDSIAVRIPDTLSGISSGMLLRRFDSWDRRMYSLAALVFLMDILSTLSSFFLPIYVYQETGSMTEAILIAIVAAIPSLFGYHLGKFTDGAGERHVLGVGLATIAVSLVAIFFLQEWVLMLIAIFFIEIALELLSLAEKSCVTKLCSPAAWGEQGSTMRAISVIGGVAGPVLVGLSFDLISAQATFLVLAGMTAALLAAVSWTFRFWKA